MWLVNNTDQAPVSCSHVNILYSNDGGMTFPITLASNTQNDGSMLSTFQVSKSCLYDYLSCTVLVVYCLGNFNASNFETVTCAFGKCWIVKAFLISEISISRAWSCNDFIFSNVCIIFGFCLVAKENGKTVWFAHRLTRLFHYITHLFTFNSIWATLSSSLCSSACLDSLVSLTWK